MESGTKLCANGSKGYEDIFSVEYQVKETLLHVLLIIMFFGGFLAMLSNSFVLFFGLTRRNLFPPEILSLAVTDFLTGLLGTPSVMAIYYFSELISSVWGYVWNQRYLQRAMFHCIWIIWQWFSPRARPIWKRPLLQSNESLFEINKTLQLQMDCSKHSEGKQKYCTRCI